VSTGNQQTLQRYARPILISSSKDDQNVPFSYQEWVSAYRGIISGQEFNQYNDYLINWYKDQNNKVTDTKLQLKINYLTLLRQLQLFFTQEEAENWYNQVNIEDEKEILLAIPYFARKLRDISLYYLQLRETIKQSRFQYNQIGTEVGLTREIQKYILLNYTQKPTNSITLPASLWKNAPDLSAVKENINIQIEELYDTNTYLDRSPSQPLSSYFDLNTPELLNFLQQKGLNSSSIDWIYQLGVYDLSANIQDETEFDYPLFAELVKQVSEKYLGSEKYLMTQTVLSTDVFNYEIPVSEGNNFFYWPTGTYESLVKISPKLQSIPLTATNIEDVATAGKTLPEADTIFVKTTRGVKGAWLRFEDVVDSKNTMLATLDGQTKTEFRFPFPGYGLSAEDTGWTGYSLQTDPRFFFLDKNTQQLISNEYWTNSFELTSCIPIKINNTTLINNKAYANKNYNFADKITVWENPPEYNSQTFTNEAKETWLYQFDKTDISIKPNSQSVVVWPYKSINASTNFPEYFPENLTDICTPTPVSAIDFTYAMPGNALSSADVIYKIKNFKDGIDNAVECFWLSGSETSGYSRDVSQIKQNTLQGIFSSGEYTRFVWEGSNNFNLNTVFRTLQHQPDCPFVNTSNIDYEQFDLCECKQVNFTPFGHPGRTYNDNNSFCDFIVEDTVTPNDLDLTVWKDSSGVPYLSSLQFFWYNTSSEVGWGTGRWVAGGQTRSRNCLLKQGKTYIYYRANLKDKSLSVKKLPDLVVRHSYNTYSSNYGSKHIWIRGIKTENGTWVSSNVPSETIIYPGDILLYDRKPSHKINYNGVIAVQQDISENRGSIWSNYNYISIDKNKQIVITYPTTTYSGMSASNQFDLSGQTPVVGLNNIVNILDWEITAPDGTATIIRNRSSAIFNPVLEGVYTTKVRVITSATVPPRYNYNITSTAFTFFYQNTGIYTFEGIPPITAVSPFVNVPTLTSYNISLPGYVLNTPLQGWDYSRSVSRQFITVRNAGAKPFWAKTYLNKDENTKFKGINKWGTPKRIIDGYNIITQPEISDIVLTPGSKISYERNYPTKLEWRQPVNLIATSNKKIWCDLEFTTNTTSNLAYQLNNYKTELVVSPKTTPSTIILENFVDNEPVEIYYNALNPFVWNISALAEIPTVVTPGLSALLALRSNAPWANLSNQNYPTVAVLPAFDNLYTVPDIGGYFTPKNLGASIYTDQDFLLTLNSYTSSFFSKTDALRGFSKQDQLTPYSITVNNTWQKEPIVSGPIAGTNKKKVFKKYQKFIPYQSNFETNNQSQIGLLTPNSKQTPWAGKENPEWGDLMNYPVSFTGELNVSKWADSQILKKTGLQVYNWCTDIFGNQYGLYKDIKNVPLIKQKDIYGRIWVRDNSQFVSPAAKSLERVFDTYTGTNLLNELTGFGVKKIDVFFDTLMVETSGTIIFEKINYDYVAKKIFSLTDEARYLSLAMPVSSSLVKEFANQNLQQFTFAKCGDTWFLPEEKIVYISVCGLQNFQLTPELYEFNINNQNLVRIFPVNNTDATTLSNLSALNLITIDYPVLTYNPLIKQFVMIVVGRNNKNEKNIVELTINNLPRITLDGISVYIPLDATIIQDPPVVQANLNITLLKPDPFGLLYSTISPEKSAITAGAKLVLQNNTDRKINLITAPEIEEQTTYPLLSFYTLTGIDDFIFEQPIATNYSIYDLNPVYIEQFGDEELFLVEPLNFICEPVANGPVIFESVRLPDWISLTPDGEFTGIAPENNQTTFSGSFKVTNSVGSTFYTLNIDIV